MLLASRLVGVLGRGITEEADEDEMLLLDFGGVGAGALSPLPPPQAVRVRRLALSSNEHAIRARSNGDFISGKSQDPECMERLNSERSGAKPIMSVV